MVHRLDVARPRSVIAWAVLCGLAAGLLAAVYAAIVGEPLVDRAIAIEEATAEAGDADAGAAGDPGDADGSDAEATGDPGGAGDGSDAGGDVVGHPAEDVHDDDTVTIGRPTQRGAGLFSAYALFGAACGLLLAATALSLRGSWLDPFRRIAVAGTILAGSVTVVPWLKYPPNPPAVGDPGTASQRQSLFFLLIALTGALLGGAAHLSARLRTAGWPDARRIATVGASAAGALGVLLAVLPSGEDPIPASVPADLVWKFRVASLGGNAILWTLLTVGFGLLCAESVRQRAVSAALRAGGTAGAVDRTAERADRAAGRAEAAEAAGPAGQNSMPFIADTPAS